MTAKKQPPKKKPAPKAAPARARVATKAKAPVAAKPAAKQFKRPAHPVAVPEGHMEPVGEREPMEAPKAAKPLTPLEERFVQEYLIDLNATQAYLRAYPGVKSTTAATEGSKHLVNPKIAAAIQKAKDERAERTGITADRALQEVWGILTADARELVEYRVGACRHCWGEDFGYQRTTRELERDRARHEQKVQKGEAEGDFDEKGGDGFNANAAPNAECPECFGDGHGRVILKDTSKLSRQAVSLYAGVKQTKEGLEVKFHSKDGAAEKMFKHLGLYEVDNKQKTDPMADFLAELSARGSRLPTGGGS